MKVMVLGLRGFPDVQGGIEKHAEHLYPLLANLGCEIHAIVRSPYVPCDRHEWQGISYTRLWSPHIKGIEALIHTFLGILYAAVTRPDILHIHAVGPSIMTPFARLVGLRVVVTHHGADYDREKWGIFARSLLRLGERWGMLYANQSIVISETIKNHVEAQYGIKPTVIPNGVAMPDIPTTTGALERYGLEKQKYILMVSRFVPEKRHLDLIEAFKRAELPGWKLALVGAADHPDEYSRTLCALVNKTPSLILTGYQSGHALRELYAHAGLFVLPSSHEGLPIALLEALSYGIPVIASDISANLEIGLPSKNYFPMGDVIALANLLQELICDRYAYEPQPDAQAAINQRYNWNNIAQQTLNIYRLARKGKIDRIMPCL